MSAKVIPFPDEGERSRRKEARWSDGLKEAESHIRNALTYQDVLVQYASKAVGREVDRPRYGNRVPHLAFSVLPDKKNVISYESHGSPLNTRVENINVKIAPSFTVPVRPKANLQGIHDRKLAEPLYMVTFGLAKFAFKYMSPEVEDPTYDRQVWLRTESTPDPAWARAHRATAAVVLHYFDFDAKACNVAVMTSPGSLSPHLASILNPMPIEDASAFFNGH